MVKTKKVLLVNDSQTTIHGGLEIMLKGLRDWHKKINPQMGPSVKVTPPLSKREKGVFPIAY